MNRSSIKYDPSEVIFKYANNEHAITSFNKGVILPFANEGGNPVCYLLHYGCVSLIRLSDQIRTFPVTERTFFGMLGGTYFQENYALVADINSAVTCHDVSPMRHLISNDNKWMDIVDMQISKTEQYTQYFDQLSVRDSYKEVCFLIKMMMELPEYIRIQIKLSHFIEQRSSVCRSNMMQILSQLKSKKYIIVHDGFLRSISYLPNNRFW